MLWLENLNDIYPFLKDDLICSSYWGILHQNYVHLVVGKHDITPERSETMLLPVVLNEVSTDDQYSV